MTRQKPESFEGKGPHVVRWDFGAKQNLIRELTKRGCRVTAVPSFYTADQILALSPDGVLLSNGPGDPVDNGDIIRQVQKLSTATLPMMGVCLGHQLMALANGASTEKLPFGHRGANQPVKDLRTGRVAVTRDVYKRQHQQGSFYTAIIHQSGRRKLIGSTVGSRAAKR